MHRSLISAAVLTLIGLAPLAHATPAAAAAAAPAGAQATSQLPRNASPTHYAVSLTPDAAASTFSATVTIALDVKQRTNTLTLHANELAFSAASISAGPGQPA